MSARLWTPAKFSTCIQKKAKKRPVDLYWTPLKAYSGKRRFEWCSRSVLIFYKFFTNKIAVMTYISSRYYTGKDAFCLTRTVEKGTAWTQDVCSRERVVFEEAFQFRLISWVDSCSPKTFWRNLVPHWKAFIKDLLCTMFGKGQDRGKNSFFFHYRPPECGERS